MPNTRTMDAIALIFASILVIAAPNFAQEVNAHELYLPNLTGVALPHFFQCLRSVVTIPRCTEELILSIFSLEIELLGPECCDALLNVDDKCWPKNLPVNPFFPATIKNYCLSTID
ncbi:unnamed protein product [Fraxinus pennsylvanica]|uniref:Prolamin-like domain-containing protein n=1 Tax=Fraxinus pennsylvanica TaxID=56036 RepID=A0AAD1ZY80_9LAMI|nr:unnamed protein product [Fraxinus pennsylvanica]